MAANTITQCKCPLAGFCNRHGVQKTALLFDKCQTDPHFFEAWENGRGPGQKVKRVENVGTELKKLISWFPVSNKENCSRCRHLEARMNRWGADICEEKKDFIVKKLGIAAKRRGLPFSPSLVGLLVDKAIRNSRKA
jgi:hypothetical protein